MPESIALAPLACSQLTLDAWLALPEGDRRALADHLVERLEAAGWEPDAAPEIRPFGPPGRTLPVLQVGDRKTGLTFSVVPGGTFEPGYGPDLLARYAELYQRLEGWRAEVEEDEEEGGWEPEPPEATWTFSSKSPCDLRRKAAVTVGPLLMACELLTPDLPGLRKLVGPLAGYWADEWKRGLAERRAWRTRWESVGPVLDSYGWSLPTTAEFEWALRAGVDSLFYWGNELPLFMAQEQDEWARSDAEESGVPAPAHSLAERCDPATTFDAIMSRSFPRGRERAWAWCNGFGLAGMLGAGTWCRPAEDPDDPHPLVVRGGAGTCYPWQGCGEWKLLLNASEKRLALSSDYADHNAVRPVVRLVPDPGVPLR